MSTVDGGQYWKSLYFSKQLGNTKSMKISSSSVLITLIGTQHISEILQVVPVNGQSFHFTDLSYPCFHMLKASFSIEKKITHSDNIEDRI